MGNSDNGDFRLPDKGFRYDLPNNFYTELLMPFPTDCLYCPVSKRWYIYIYHLWWLTVVGGDTRGLLSKLSVTIVLMLRSSSGREEIQLQLTSKCSSRRYVISVKNRFNKWTCRVGRRGAAPFDPEVVGSNLGFVSYYVRLITYLPTGLRQA